MARSPLHYLHSVQSEFEETRPMRVGSCVHALVLGGEYHVYEGERRGNAWKEFKVAHDDGKTIVTTSEFDDATAIANAVLSDPVAAVVMAAPRETEIELDWTWLGRACAGRLDLVRPDLLADLKVSSTSELDRFQAQAIRMAYHAQLAWYLRALGRPLTSAVYVIVVEDHAPYPVTVRRLTDRALEAGEKLCRLWMEQLLCCEQAGAWPGYAQSVVPLDLPEWADEQTLIIDGEEVAV